MEVPKTNFPNTISPIYFLRTLWLLTCSDLTTFIIPQSLFGYFSAFSCLALTSNITPTTIAVTLRLPYMLLWTWLNIVIFTLANQRSKSSILEDRINKPWRPIASGRLSPKQAQHLLVAGMPIVLLASHILGGFQETALLFVLTWMYNDLGASDDNIFVRNLALAVAHMLYGLGALKVACRAGDCTITPHAHVWLCLMGLIILTTIHVPDLKDIEGDRARNRKTFPLVVGQEISRWSIAVSVLCWSPICVWFWDSPRIAYAVLMTLGIVLAWRLVVLRDFGGDQNTWKLWASWLLACYMLPAVNVVYEDEILGRLVNSKVIHAITGIHDLGSMLISNT